MTIFHLPFAMLSQARIVPLIVEYDAFWTRYFYRLHRLEQKHAQFQQLTERTLAAQEVEEVRWALLFWVSVPCVAACCNVSRVGLLALTSSHRPDSWHAKLLTLGLPFSLRR